jgi:hypothetical protein
MADEQSQYETQTESQEPQRASGQDPKHERPTEERGRLAEMVMRQHPETD